MMNTLVWNQCTVSKKRLGLALGLVLVTLLWYLAPTSLQGFMGIGDYWSEKVAQRQGIADSNLVISRDGVAGDLQVVMGPVPITNPVTHMMGATNTILSGTLGLNGFPNADVWWEWGYTPTYEQGIVGFQAGVGAGNHQFDFGGAGVDFGQIIHYRFAGETDGINYGADQVITVTSAGWYALAQILPYVFLGVAILMVFGLVYSGVPLIYAIILGAVLAIVGAVGTDIIVDALQALF